MYIFYERMRSECLKLGFELGLEERRRPFIVLHIGHHYLTWYLEKGTDEIRETEKE